MDKQPHTENFFDHLTGIRQISLKPHKDLVYQWECDQSDLEIQMPHYSLALEKCSDLRLRGFCACFVRFPTLSLDAARTPTLCQAHVSRGCSRTIYAGSFFTELPCFAIWESLFLSLFSLVANYSCTLLWSCKKRKHSAPSVHAPFPLPLVCTSAWPTVSFNHIWPQAVPQMLPLKSACACGEV